MIFINNYFFKILFLLSNLALFGGCSLIEKPYKQSTNKPSKVDGARSPELTKRQFNEFNQRSMPKGKNGKIINREGFTIQYNRDCRIAHWASYEIKSKDLIKKVERQDDFAPDELLDLNQATLDDYDEPIYDRGHLARAKLFTRSAKLMSESFRLSNIVPQDPFMNRNGAWKQAEDFEYQVASKNKKIFVVSGPILTSNPKVIGLNKVCVPDSLFKVILNLETKDGIGFIIPNRKENKKFTQYQTTIDEVELVTGLDFFHELDDITENAVESQSNILNWKTSKDTAPETDFSHNDESSTSESPPVKKSRSGNKCHTKESRYYLQTKYFTSYKTLKECRDSGGQ